MKYVIVLGDGMADEPSSRWEDTTSVSRQTSDG